MEVLHLIVGKEIKEGIGDQSNFQRLTFRTYSLLGNSLNIATRWGSSDQYMSPWGTFHIQTHNPFLNVLFIFIFVLNHVSSEPEEAR